VGLEEEDGRVIMNEPPVIAPLPRNQQNIDIDHLNLLSIFHFVGAGFAALGTVVMILECVFMHFIFASPALWENQRQPPPPEGLFALMSIMYGVIAVWCIISMILNLLSGIFLRARENRTFSFVVAAINCLHMPLGTVLGVFTIIVLSRPSVRELYESPV
jgi:hypothetical protein